MKLAVSACLLGQRVRYDGGHKLLPFFKDAWGGLVEFLPVCPETQAGLPTPREPVELFNVENSNPHSTALRALGLETGDDYTDRLSAWARDSLCAFDDPGLLGFVLKSGSPSCGTRIRVNAAMGLASAHGEEGFWGSGLFVQALKNHLPLLPVTDELAFMSRAGREHFLVRAFVLRRWREAQPCGADSRCLLEFHLQIQPLLSSLAPDLLSQLTTLAHAASRGGTADGYEELLLEFLGRPHKNEGGLERLATLLDVEELALVEASARYGDG